jgi:hypothetical protein
VKEHPEHKRGNPAWMIITCNSDRHMSGKYVDPFSIKIIPDHPDQLEAPGMIRYERHMLTGEEIIKMKYEENLEQVIYGFWKGKTAKELYEELNIKGVHSLQSFGRIFTNQMKDDGLIERVKGTRDKWKVLMKGRKKYTELVEAREKIEDENEE